MKNKKRIICIFSIVAVLGMLFWVLAAKGGKKLALNELQVNGEFQYAKAAWGISVEEAERNLSVKLEWDENRSVANGNTMFYISKEAFLMDGHKANASLEFANDQLQLIQISFSDSEQDWYENQIKILQKLYGQEKEKVENALGSLLSQGYRWDTEKTSLQVVYMRDAESTKGRMIISIGLK